MPRSTSQKKNKQYRNAPKSVLTQQADLPNHLKKDRFIYVDGVIEKSCHGVYHVELENGMQCLATARKMDTFYRVGLMAGDSVICEIDPLGLEPNNPKVKGRVVWRKRI